MISGIEIILLAALLMGAVFALVIYLVKGR